MRKLASFAVPFSAAVFAVRYGVWPLALVLLPAALVLREERRLRCALVCAGLACGFLWCRGYDALCRAPARAMEGRTLTLSAAAADWPWETNYGGAVTIRISPEEGPSFLARLYGDNSLLALRPGDMFTCVAQCRAPDLVRGRESADYTAKGVFLLAYAKGSVMGTRPERVPLRYVPAYWTRALQEGVAAAVPPDAAPLVTALLTGDKTGLPDADYAALQRAGLAHAVAVSGLHIGFLAQLAVALAGSRYRRRAALLAVPLMVVYALAVGCTPSVLRAVVMHTLLLLGAILGRETDPPTSLSFALMLLLLQNPYAARSVSLQLSFASVAGIAAFSGRVHDWLWGGFRFPKEKKRLRRLPGALCHGAVTSLSTTVGALTFTIPLAAGYFGSLSLASPLANLLCLPLVALAFPLGLLAALLALFSPALGAAAGMAAALPVRLLLLLTRGFAALPFAGLTLESGYLRAWLTFAYALWVLFVALRGRRPLVPLCCCVMSLCCALVLTHAAYNLGPLTVTVLNVGQGQSVVLRAGERTAVVDCGGSARRNAGDLCADYLGTFGRSRVDLLVLTHFHADHANGVLELLARVKVDVLAVPDVERDDPLRRELLSAAEESGTQIWLIRDDETVELGPARLTLYAPLGAGEADEEGLSLLCETGRFSALLTGDMGADVEARLVKYGALPEVDLLLAGHHGSQNATSQLLLDTVEPSLAAISVGYNSYGHPAPETLRRLEESGCSIYRTDLQGNITVTVGPGPR